METIKGWHIALFVFCGIVLGAMTTLGVMQPWRVSEEVKQQWPDIKLSTSIAKIPLNTSTSTVPNENIDIQNTALLTPKSSVTQAYHESFNGLIRAADAISRINNEKLTPLLVEMNRKNAAGDYDGFFDLIVQAKELNKQQLGLLVATRSELDRLRGSNEKTSDETIRAATARVILTGGGFHDAFVQYASVLDLLLDGREPDEKIIQDLQSSVARTQTESKSFSDAVAALLEAISARLQADSAKK